MPLCMAPKMTLRPQHVRLSHETVQPRILRLAVSLFVSLITYYQVSCATQPCSDNQKADNRRALTIERWGFCSTLGKSIRGRNSTVLPWDVRPNSINAEGSHVRTQRQDRLTFLEKSENLN